MAIILRYGELEVHRQGAGWKELTLADHRVTGIPFLLVRLWSLEPHGRGPETVHEVREGLFYVVRGGGAASVDGEQYPLEPESILWLEAGERYAFEAGDGGLEVLQGSAPETDRWGSRC